MQFTLEEYQERSVQLMIESPFHYLAYEMGLGKTMIVLEYLRRTGKSALVVAPLLVAQRTWPQEVKKWKAFRDELDTVVLHGPHKDLLVKTKARIKIINYDGLKWLYNHVKERGSNDLASRVLVLDEGTYIKSPNSTRFKVLKSMQHFFTEGTFVLSGTPMPNGYKDIWSQYWMLDRGAALGKSFGEFKRRYFFESGPPRWVFEERQGAAEQIRASIAPMTSVLRAKDYLKLPETIHRTIPVELPASVREKYDTFKKDLVTTLEGTTVDAVSEGVLVNKLRQVTQGAFYHEDGVEFTKLHSAKLDALEELYTQADGDPILCPINFKFEVAMIRERLGDVPCIVGGMNLKEKEAILNKWDKGQVPLLLCHPASMSHGVNIQLGGRLICWYGLPWSLEHYQQLNGRLVRRGQNRTVVIYHIKAEQTIDTRLTTVLAKKDITQEEFKRAMLEGIKNA